MADAYRTGLSAVEPLSMSDAGKMMGIGGSEPSPADQDAAPVDKGADNPQNQNEPPADPGPAQDDQPRDGADAEAAAGDDQPPGETEPTEDADPAEDQPPIEPPRSWTKAEKEAFAALPRNHQETLVERERARERDIRKRQDDVVAVAKAVQAKEEAAEQARTRYEAGIKQLTQQAGAFVASEFKDIKTQEDVDQMRRENPMRYLDYQAAVAAYQGYQAEQNRIASENQRKQHEAFQNYVQAEDAKFFEVAPEFVDPKQAPQLSAEVNAMLSGDYGVTQQELADIWAGTPVSILDHRFRLILRDALAFKKMKAGLKPKPNPNPKPASPPPQRPGTPPAKGEAVNRTLEKANEDLTRTGSRAAALALMRARRA